MEEYVGRLWDRIISRASRSRYPQAAVSLEDVRGTLGVFFRALGGDCGLRVEATTASRHAARRGWLQRLAGTDQYAELAWSDDIAVRLPAVVDLYPDRALNRDAYLWLAALAAHDDGCLDKPWVVRNQRLTRACLAAWPGLNARYRRLVAAELAQRPVPGDLPADEAAQEHAVRAALARPGSVARLPVAARAPWPVQLWLHPQPPVADEGAAAGSDDGAQAPTADPARPRDRRRRRGERVDNPDSRDGLLLFRYESIFTWGDYVRVNRCGDDEDDDDRANAAAQDFELMNLARSGANTASRVRFDLDLPAAASDDIPLGGGILLPEWDYRAGVLRPDHCRLQPMVAAAAQETALPAGLRRPARRLRAQFEALRPERRWQRGQPEGTEVDVDAYVRYATDRRNGVADAERGMYRDFRGACRDLACLLLADLSLSTDAWVNNSARVIDVIRETLFLFAEALSATRDAFGIYGFSSRRRDHVRFHVIKDFDESYTATVRGRIQAIKPGYYTRMGAAIRHAGALLHGRPASQKLLLLLTDGKPNDLDRYEGRYGIEDTRVAIAQARQQGLQPFCVTIDEEAGDYLPHLFGSDGYVLIRTPSELPRRLPLLYARLTR